LHRCNGTNAGGGNTLLKQTHISSKSGLVTHSGGNTAEEGGHLGTCLGESENIVDEEQHILTLSVTEVLSNSETSEGHTGTSTWGLVHLTVHKGGLGTVDGLSLVVHLDDTTFNHLVVEIITLTGTFTDTGKHRVTTVVHGDIVDKLHDHDRFADTGTAKKSNLTTLSVGGEQVHNLDTSDENLLRLTLLSESGGRTVDRSTLLGLNRTLLIHRLANDVEDTSQGGGSDGNHDRVSSIITFLSTNKTLGGLHGNGSHGVLTKMLGNLKNETGLVFGNLDLKGIKNRWKLTVELDIDDGTNDLSHTTNVTADQCGRRVSTASN
jgi:peptide chain release factor 1